MLFACVAQFFASMMSTFTLNVIQSYVHDMPWRLSYSGLLNFGQFTVSARACASVSSRSVFAQAHSSFLLLLVVVYAILCFVIDFM